MSSSSSRTSGSARFRGDIPLEQWKSNPSLLTVSESRLNSRTPAVELRSPFPCVANFSDARCTGECPWVRAGDWTTKVHQHPERAVPQRAQEFLAQGKVAHVGFVQDDLPYVVPTLYHYSPDQPDRLYLHGGMSSRMLEELAKGIPVCVTVTELDGLVYSRDAKYHSANYRSVMCFGRGRIFQDEDAKRVMFEAMTQRYFPGRTAGRDYTPAPSSHLTSTAGGRSSYRTDQRQDARRRPKRPTGRRLRMRSAPAAWLTV